MRGADIHELTRNTNIRSRGVARDDAIFCDVNRFGAEGAIDCAINLYQPGSVDSASQFNAFANKQIAFNGFSHDLHMS